VRSVPVAGAVDTLAILSLGKKPAREKLVVFVKPTAFDV
jgi:hypothetical protein